MLFCCQIRFSLSGTAAVCGATKQWSLSRGYHSFPLFVILLFNEENQVASTTVNGTIVYPNRDATHQRYEPELLQYLVGAKHTHLPLHLPSESVVSILKIAIIPQTLLPVPDEEQTKQLLDVL